MVDQAEQVATRIGILDGGRITMEGTAAELKDRLGAATMDEVFARATRKDSAATQRFLETLGP